MKINELILEQQQLDELNLKGAGTGLGKAAGAIAGGAVQGAKNFWKGATQGYKTGQQALAPGRTQQAPTSTATPGPAGTTGGPGEVAATNILARAQQGTTQDPNAPQSAPAGIGSDQVTAPQDASQAPVQAPTQAPTKPGKVGVPAGKQAVDQAVATVQSVRSDRRPQVIQYAKQKVDALAGQAAKPAVPTQAELDADHDRLATGTNEGFHSKFLGMVI